ncbi:hypothetical protein MRB53_027908 [Persea americana]|uniref:Uncharacterized protein n=1 Tax=Persea americana TaxID=3435 RepID=A0ACC2KEI4_PERAE|nr:hypothetical protein MRB53_027908 [Persea americana]
MPVLSVLPMESLMHSATALSSKSFRFHCKERVSIKDGILANGFSFSRPFLTTQRLSVGFRERESVIVRASAEDEEEKKKKRKKKVDTHSFVVKPDEATGAFPEAVLLKERKLREDGRSLPDFADAEEEKLFESLNLEMEKKLNFELMRHYEVVFLVHEDRVNEIESVKTKVEEFIRENKGIIWRSNDWGLRRLAYKIQKAKNAYYVLMNIELGAKWINDFRSMLLKDERVIRHLVIKRDEAITEDCPPPPEFHTLRANVMDEVDVDGDDEQDWDDESELGVVSNSEYSDDGEDNGSGEVRKEAKTLKAERVAR